MIRTNGTEKWSETLGPNPEEATKTTLNGSADGTAEKQRYNSGMGGLVREEQAQGTEELSEDGYMRRCTYRGKRKGGTTGGKGRASSKTQYFGTSTRLCGVRFFTPRVQSLNCGVHIGHLQ